MWKDFREFAMRGNVLDLAVAVVIGAAFTAIVTSLVEDVIMPLIGLIMGGLDFSSLSITVRDSIIAYGNFIQAIVNFLLIAFVLFLAVRGANRLQKSLEEEKAEQPAPAPEPTQEEKLLTEIRDLLKEQA